MRDGLLEKLEPVFAAILAGRPEDEVYALWREHHRRRRRRGGGAAAGSSPPARARRPRTRRAARRSTVTVGPAAGRTPCTAPSCADSDGERRPAVLAASLAEHSARPLHLWVLGAARPTVSADALAERFPGLGVSGVPIGGARARPGPAAAAELLPDVGRVVLLPLPAVATGDVAELADARARRPRARRPARPGRRA